MKTLWVIAAGILLNQMPGSAQSGICGIYRNSAEFKSGNAALAGKNTCLNLHEVFKTNLLQVRYNDSTYTFRKDELYGYKDEDDQIYRLSHGKPFQIMNPSEQMLLYKTTSGTGLKNSPHTNHYFFSTEAGTEIQPLTLPNLKKAYAGDPPFLNLIAVSFSKDPELTSWDKVHRKYKLNSLLDMAHAKS